MAPSGEIVVVGSAGELTQEAWMRRFDADGCLVAEEDPALDLPASEPPESFAHGIAIDPSGAVYVCGEHGSDAWLRKFAPDGALEWSAVYTPDGGLAEFHALSIGVDGIDVVGRAYWEDQPLQATIARYDWDGGLVWLATDETQQWFRGVTSLPDGTAIAYASGGTRVAAFAGDGAPLWTYSHALPDGTSELVTDATAWNDHLVFVGDAFEAPGMPSYGFLGELALDGSEVAFEYVLDAGIHGVEVDDDGNLVLLGTVETTVGSEAGDLSGDVWLAARTPGGRVLWTERFDDGGDQRPYGMAVGHGRIAVTGTTTESARPPFGDGAAWVGLFAP